MGIIVEYPGILTTVQDAGRFGYQQFGVSPAGPMDTRSFALANILVGNKRTQGGLEITFQGPTLRFDEDTVIAITGGSFLATLNGNAIESYRAIGVKKGDVLVTGTVAGNGCRGYIAFAGGLDVPMVMGSKSTLLRNKLGGYKGRGLEEGDRIGFVNPKPALAAMDERWLVPERFPQKEVVLRVVIGPQDTAFSSEELRRFFWYGATITNEFDRMGCRLNREEPLKQIGDGNIISDGIAFGSIQIPTNGQPIIMLADRQSTGGYAKLGTVISIDLPLLVQSMPGYKVRFVQIGVMLAQKLYLRQEYKLKQLENYYHGLEEEV